MTYQVLHSNRRQIMSVIVTSAGSDSKPVKAVKKPKK